ncbi:MAG: hypothetical protein ABIT05_15855 [Chitinophagaceae bacterium]
MNMPFYNDQAHIAESFSLADTYTTERARLAFFKINSYKLSLVNAAFCITREELTGIIKSTLLNYTDPASILADIGFFEAGTEN